jgi:hypothetical protein
MMGRPKVSLDCSGFREPDLADLDALLRLQLALKRTGGDLVLQLSGPHLGELIALIGLEDVLDCRSVEPGRESEEGE